MAHAAGEFVGAPGPTDQAQAEQMMQQTENR